METVGVTIAQRLFLRHLGHVIVLRTLRPQDTSAPRHFSTSVPDTSAPVPSVFRHFGTGTELSQDTSGRCGRPTADESDSDVSMQTHVFRTVSSCFATLRQLRSIRRSTSQAVLLSLVVSLVLSRLDYGYATLAGLPCNQIVDRLVCDERRCTTCLLCAEVRAHHPATP